MKYTTSEFIQKALLVHKGKFDYSKSVYIDSKTKVKIICNNCGLEFLQNPSRHLYGDGCPVCSHKKVSIEKYLEKAKIIFGDNFEYDTSTFKTCNSKLKIKCKNCGMVYVRSIVDHLRGNGCNCLGKMTIQDFVEKAGIIHNNKYDYSLVDGLGKIKIICPTHGVFEQNSNKHLSGDGCPVCAGRKKTTDDFIAEANLIHNNKYDYSLVSYQTSHIKVKIICPIHGVFEQTPNKHLLGRGCAKCSGKTKYTIQDFLRVAHQVHSERYDYSMVSYENNNSRIKIICPKHGVFEQSASNHLRGDGCPICCESRGEKAIAKFLTENNIEFERQKKFPDCKHIKVLPFDFYLPTKNICIEFDGAQHYGPVKAFGGVEEFEKVKIRDKIKTDYCLSKNIKLVRIKYNEKINLDFLIDKK